MGSSGAWQECLPHTSQCLGLRVLKMGPHSTYPFRAGCFCSILSLLSLFLLLYEATAFLLHYVAESHCMKMSQFIL